MYASTVVFRPFYKVFAKRIKTLLLVSPKMVVFPLNIQRPNNSHTRHQSCSAIQKWLSESLSYVMCIPINFFGLDVLETNSHTLGYKQQKIANVINKVKDVSLTHFRLTKPPVYNVCDIFQSINPFANWTVISSLTIVFTFQVNFLTRKVTIDP